ncbi:hypothetical protein HMI54_011317 [Coelomomyces lativittatus]|nr:hypothetical protein HMI54_011317 [Coelomomyces lativittatus]
MLPKLLDKLKELQIKATILINGHNIMRTINETNVAGKESQWTTSTLASYIKKAYDGTTKLNKYFDFNF